MYTRRFYFLGSGGMYASKGTSSMGGDISFTNNSAEDSGGTLFGPIRNILFHKGLHTSRILSETLIFHFAQQFFSSGAASGVRWFAASNSQPSAAEIGHCECPPQIPCTVFYQVKDRLNLRHRIILHHSSIVIVVFDTNMFSMYLHLYKDDSSHLLVKNFRHRFGCVFAMILTSACPSIRNVMSLYTTYG